MPYSSSAGKRIIDDWVHAVADAGNASYFTTDPCYLDVGPGCGTYSARYRPVLPGRWLAIEIWAPYIEKFELAAKYDEVIVADVRDALQRLDACCFRLAFAGDVLEHLEPEVARQVVAKLLALSDILVVSIPLGHYPQDAYLGNPYERHVKDDWSHAEVVELLGEEHIIAADCEESIGVYVCSQGAELRARMRAVLRSGLAPCTLTIQPSPRLA